MENWTSVFLFISGLIVSFLSFVSKYLFDKVSDHEKRIQKIEDIQGTKLDQLGREIHELKNDVSKIARKVDELASQVHKEKNVEMQISHTLEKVLIRLEKLDDKEYGK